MRLIERNGSMYILDMPATMMLKRPTIQHRFKRGSGTCSFKPHEWYTFTTQKTHLAFHDVSLKKVFIFTKEDVLPTVTTRDFYGSSLIVAELMQLYIAKKYTELSFESKD